jgi:menaquinone-dependent protoporphyrinogen IX oxidase
MNTPRPRVLVATASKHGATHEVGEEIARALREEGVDATWAPAEDVGDPAAFDAFVVGKRGLRRPLTRPGQ